MILTDSKARELQTFLDSVGLYGGEIDGDVGTQTVKAAEALAAGLEFTPKVVTAPSSLGAAIITAAKKYVGLSEIKPNAKWDDLSTPGVDAAAAKLLAGLLSEGWETGWAYCIAGAELAWHDGFEAIGKGSDFLPFSKLITVSVLQTYNNLNAKGLISKSPVPGAIFLAQHGATSNGHAGIVTSVSGSTISTIEWNTSPTSADVAKDREGDGVYAKSRSIGNFTQTSGLWIRGFVNPPTI